MYNILFICTGNICRSPSAEGFFAHHLARSAYRQYISCDSAGTHGYHTGDSPDTRAIRAAAQHGVDIGHLRARKVTVDDFAHFDLIIAMDHANLSSLQALQPVHSGADLQLMMRWHPNAETQEVADPYYDDFNAFRHMCRTLDVATTGLLKHLEVRLAGQQAAR